MIHNISYIMVAAIKAVLPDGSNGGATSTRSAPTILHFLNPRIISWAWIGIIPPISGVPVSTDTKNDVDFFDIGHNSLGNPCKIHHSL